MCFQNMKLLGQKKEIQFFAINPTLVIFLQEGTDICLSMQHVLWQNENQKQS